MSIREAQESEMKLHQNKNNIRYCLDAMDNEQWRFIDRNCCLELVGASSQTGQFDSPLRWTGMVRMGHITYVGDQYAVEPDGSVIGDVCSEQQVRAMIFMHLISPAISR